jgi:hypothetical protein
MTSPLSAQTAVEGRYLLDAPLDGWGLGEVWQCRDKNFRNRAVVLKFLPPERAERLGDAAQELRAQRALKHAHVLPVINQGTFSGRAWVAYDGFDGTSLARTLSEARRTRTQLDAATVREVFSKVLGAVTAAHEAATPVLHGCLQTASVIVKGEALKVIDFGLHPFVTPDALGPFRAPELARETESPTIASDVYALGATLADLLLPQGVGDPRRALEALLTGRDGPQSGRSQRPDVAAAIWDVIARATLRDPVARWDDVNALRVALDAAWQAAPLPAPSRPMVAPTPAPMLVPVAPLPPAGPAFSATMPPLAGVLPPATVPGPAPAFSRPATMPPVSAPAMRAPVPVNAWDPPPSYPPTPPATPSPGDAWASVRPQMPRTMEQAMVSAWDPLPPAQVPSPPSPWGAPAPMARGPLVAGARPAEDDEWDEQTQAADPSRMASAAASLARQRAVQESTMALDVDALTGGLPSLPSESTMALDVDALTAAAQPRASRPVQTTRLEDDWKDSVVMLNTTTGSTAPTGVGDDDDDDVPYEPGSRTNMAPAPAEVLDTMETLQPRRNMAVEAYLASANPIPTSERTMAIDTGARPSDNFATMPAPMAGPAYGMPPPRAPMPMPMPVHQPQPAFAKPLQAPPSSKGPIIAAVIGSLLLVGAAVAFALVR